MDETLNANETRDPVVFARDGKPIADSRDVAAFFGKEHKNVLRDIRELINKEPKLLGLKFEPFKNNDLTGESTSHVEMDRDGFTLLAMGFTGERALRWKIRYIEAFNRMEERLKQGSASGPRLEEIVGLVVEAIHRHDEARERAIEERVVARISQGMFLKQGKTPGEIWNECGFPKVKGIAKWFGNRLALAGCFTGDSKGNDTSRARAFDADKARRWINNGGRFLVEQKIAERRGQGKLNLVVSKPA